MREPARDQLRRAGGFVAQRRDELGDPILVETVLAEREFEDAHGDPAAADERDRTSVRLPGCIELRPHRDRLVGIDVGEVRRLELDRVERLGSDVREIAKRPWR